MNKLSSAIETPSFSVGEKAGMRASLSSTTLANSAAPFTPGSAANGEDPKNLLTHQKELL